jgi:Domain of unknown function (DUF4157)
LRSSGQPLDPVIRAFMEPRLGYDFSSVRVHSGVDARRSATELNAKAYTVGHNIVFGADQFTPGTQEGQRLIAHELAHVIQQASSSPRPAGSSGNLEPGTIAKPTATSARHLATASRVQSAVSRFEAEATSATENLTLHRPVAVTGREVPAIARSPADQQEDTEDEEWYQADRAEDIAEGRAKPKRGARRGQSASTPGSVAREAEHEVTQMLADATAGKYQSSATKTKGRLVAKFRRLLKSYRVDEMMSIEQQLTAGTLAARQRRALVNRKMGIVADRNYLQGKFDEAARTPRGGHIDVQQKIVRGGPAQGYHETRPGKGSYAQPDYSFTGESEAGGRIRIHVNLKSHNLGNISLADARAIARAARDQAVKNAFGGPKRYGDVGHLPQGDEAVISFTDKPPREIQEAMVEIMFEKGTPISQVRFGESTWHRPPGQLEPPVPPLEVLLGGAAPTTSQKPVRPPGAVDPAPAPASEVEHITVPGATAPAAPEVEHITVPGATAPAQTPRMPASVTPPGSLLKARLKVGLKAGAGALAWMVAFAALNYFVEKKLKENLEDNIQAVRNGERPHAVRLKARTGQTIYLKLTVSSSDRSQYIPLVGWIPHHELDLLSEEVTTTPIDSPTVTVVEDHTFNPWRPGKVYTVTYTEVFIP